MRHRLAIVACLVFSGLAALVYQVIWIRLLGFAFRSMGTRVRYGRAEGERAHELCVAAGRQALRSAGMDPGEIDLLIYVGVGRGFIEPATANAFQDLLGLRPRQERKRREQKRECNERETA